MTTNVLNFGSDRAAQTSQSQAMQRKYQASNFKECDDCSNACKPKLKANAPIMFQGASDIVSNSMKLFREQEALLECLSVLLLLSGCGGAEPECGSLDTRNSVVKRDA